MVELFGVYRHKVDAKGRLALPAKFRKELSEDLVVIIDPLGGGCLYVFTIEDYQEWVKSFFKSEGEFDPNNADLVKKRRKLRAMASSVSCDTAGRINLDASMREVAGIEKEVALVGNEGYFEIWDAKRWDDYCEENF